jgi:hypothetical protein
MPSERRTEAADHTLHPRQAPPRGGPRDLGDPRTNPHAEMEYDALAPERPGERRARQVIGVALLAVVLVIAVVLLVI